MIDIQYTDSNTIKLTITPNRVTLKFPKDSSEEIVQEYTNYTNKIIDKFKPTYSFRGRFKINPYNGFLGISMKGNNSSETIYFKCE